MPANTPQIVDINVDISLSLAVDVNRKLALEVVGSEYEEEKTLSYLLLVSEVSNNDHLIWVNWERS